MPLYDYQCTTCDTVTEVRHGFKEAFEGTCPSCGAAGLKRVFNPAPILFKGSGFYVTDSRGKAGSSEKASSSDKASGDKSSSDTTSSSGDGKKSESPAA